MSAGMTEERKKLMEEAKRYKEILVEGILSFQTRNQFTREELEKKTISALERIHDYVD